MSREKIVFSDFDSGLSSDQYLGKDGTVGDCSNLEMRRNARFARLSSVLADSFVGITLDGPIIKMVNAYEYIHGSTPVNQVLAVCMGDSTHGGCIYDETGAKVYSFGATEKIVGWNEIILPNSPSDIDGATEWLGDNYFVIFTYDTSTNWGRVYVVRINLALGRATWGTFVHQLWWTNDGATTAGNVVISGVLGTAPDAYGISSINPTNEYLAFAYNQQIFTIPSVLYVIGTAWSVFKNTLVPLAPGESVVNMSVFADKVHVYTSKMKKNGRYYIYGTGSMNTQNGVPDYRFEWNGRGILNAVNVGNADWLICKTNKYTSLWYNQGFYPNKIFERVNEDGTQVMDFECMYPNCMMDMNGLILIAGKGGIYSFGHIMDGRDDGMQRDYTLPNCDATSCIGRVGLDNEIFLVSYHDSVSNTWKMKNFLLSIPPAIYSDGSPMYQHSGEVVSKVFTGGYVGDIKQTVELNIGYLIPAKTTTGISASIAIYGRVSPKASFTLMTTIDNTVQGFIADTPMRFKLPAGNLPAALREWRTIEFKAVLTAGSTNTVVSSVTKTDDQTPYFYDLQCEYDNDIKN